MRSRVEKVLFIASVVFVCAAPDARAAGDGRVHGRIDCVRSVLPYADSAVGMPAPVSYDAAKPAIRRADEADPSPIPEEVPVPSAVWLTAIGFGFAASALRRKRN